jgi:hypothetical protein
MKVQITDRKTLEKLVIAMLTDIKVNEIDDVYLKDVLKEKSSPKVYKEIFNMRYMTTGGIARKLFDLIYSADYSHGALIIDADIAEDLLGEPLNQYMKRQEEINQLRLNTSPMSTWKSSKEAE